MGQQKCNKCHEIKPLLEYRFRNDVGYHAKICKTCNRLRTKEWIKNNLDHNREKARQYYYKNKDSQKKNHEAWKERNPNYYKDYMKSYHIKNKPHLKESTKKYYRERYKNDPNYRMRRILGGRVRRVFNQQRANKNNTTLELLGCSLDFIKKHITNQFTEGMTWDRLMNGEIHIDHIKPCASFDLTDPEQQKECFNYTNLQPLWAKDNLSKGARYEF